MESSPGSEEWYVYILRCADNTLYTGITNDPGRRLNKHNKGKASKYTRARLPVVYEVTIPVRTRSAALKLEIMIKRMSRSHKEFLIKSRTARDKQSR